MFESNKILRDLQREDRHEVCFRNKVIFYDVRKKERKKKE